MKKLISILSLCLSFAAFGQSTPRSVSTISQLLTLPGSLATPNVWVDGYTNVADGYGGWFNYVTNSLATNTTTVFAAMGGGSWQLVGSTNIVQTQLNGRILSTNGMAYNMTVADQLNIAKRSGSNGPAVFFNGYNNVDQSFPGLAVPAFQPSNSGGINLDLIPKGAGSYSSSVDIIGMDLTLPGGLTNAAWLHLHRNAGFYQTIGSDAGPGGTNEPLYIQPNGTKVGIGAFGPSGRTPIWKIQLSPYTGFNLGIDAINTGLFLYVGDDAGTTQNQLTVQAKSFNFTSDRLLTTLFTATNNSFGVGNFVDAQNTLILPFEVRDSTNIFTVDNEPMLGGSVNGMRLSAFNTTFTSQPIFFQNPSFFVTTDGNSTAEFRVTNNTVTIGGTKGTAFQFISSGTATLSAGLATVSNANITANSQIVLTPYGGILGAVGVSNVVAGVSFQIVSLSVADTNRVGYVIFGQ